MPPAGNLHGAARNALKSAVQATNNVSKHPSTKRALRLSPSETDASKPTDKHGPANAGGQHVTGAAGTPMKDASEPSVRRVEAGDFVDRGKVIARILYDPHPRPINVVTLTATKAIADDPSHPFHIRTRRRLASFDPGKLHWRVHVPMEVSKKSAIRNWAKKRVMRAFYKALEEQGFTKDGKRQEGNGVGVKGALLMILNKDANIALAFEQSQAEMEASTLLQETFERQNRRSKPR